MNEYRAHVFKQNGFMGNAAGSKAIATVTDGEREWNVVIYSLYKTIKEANDGISRFAAHGYNIVKAWIE